MQKALQYAEDGMAYPVLTNSQQEEMSKPSTIKEENIEEELQSTAL